MTKYQCSACGHVDDIKWGVTGHKISGLVISFRCKNCGMPYKMKIVPRKSQDHKVKLEKEDRNYIG